MNCVENLPVYGAIVVALTVVGLRSPVVDGLSEAMLAARIGQTLVHVTLRQTNAAVSVRFALFSCGLSACSPWAPRRGSDNSLKRSRPRRRLSLTPWRTAKMKPAGVFEEETAASPLAANGLYARLGRLQFGAAALIAMAKAAQSGGSFENIT